MASLFDGVRISAPNYSKYNNSIHLTFQEACDLFETRLPALLKESLADQEKEVADYKKNLSRAKKLGIV